ncbi:hypothetical protein AsAng_0060710 [Aureispira anguillae]|uniref:Uncharacterized protein n=2 Tax=Aureispira anguillae TaxID=2864201 RepID=A0A915YL87_9BACT|nr:hypothetical protein AsAng_0060710 [Aureispira anguillae]
MQETIKNKNYNRMDKSDYIKHINDGMTYEEVKKMVQLDGLNQEDLSSLMKELDDLILQRNEEKEIQKQAREWMWVGIGFCLIAIVMFLYSFFDPESVYIYLVYAIFMGGMLVFWAGKQKRKTALDDE